MRFLSARLRHVRILNGSWERATTSGILQPLPVRQGDFRGVFLDRPCSDEVAGAVCTGGGLWHGGRTTCAWCEANGDNRPAYRIVTRWIHRSTQRWRLAGGALGQWFPRHSSKGGMGNRDGGQGNQHRERFRVYPPLGARKVTPQMDLFA